MKPLSTVAAFALVMLGSGAVASAAPILELEYNSEIAAAQLIPVSAFTLPVPSTVFNPPGYATATVNGLGGGADIDFFAFTATGGNVYFDIDNDPSTFDSILSLFDSTGTLLAVADDSFPEDPGTQFGADAFLGVFTLPGPGTYYIAVTTFANFPRGQDGALSFTFLTRPDGVASGYGGYTVNDPVVGDSSFRVAGTNGTSPYTLHISVQNPGTQSVPEPVTLALLGAGLTAAALRRRRK